MTTNMIVAPNAVQVSQDFTVEEHRKGLGGAHDWVIALGNAIQEITGCDPAVATSRARDMSSNPSVAQGIEHFATSWLEIQPALSGGLNP